MINKQNMQYEYTRNAEDNQRLFGRRVDSVFRVYLVPPKVFSLLLSLTCFSSSLD